MLQALLRRALAGAGIQAEMESAGTDAAGGQLATPEVVEVMREYGLEVSGHRSQRLGMETVAHADVVIALARAHLREVIVLDPPLADRAFTIKELVRRADDLGPRPSGADLNHWLASLASTRDLAELLGDSPVDDVADPIGQPIGAVRKCAGELADLSDRAVRLLWPEWTRKGDSGAVSSGADAPGIV
jgi:protein-tyrosine-phosphatase